MARAGPYFQGSATVYAVEWKASKLHDRARQRPSIPKHRTRIGGYVAGVWIVGVYPVPTFKHVFRLIDYANTDTGLIMVS